MSSLISDIIKIFSANTLHSSFQEDIDCFSASLSGEFLCIPDEDIFSRFIKGNDWFSLTVLDESNESIDTYVSNSDTVIFIDFKKDVNIHNGYKLKFEIHKYKASNHLSVYDLNLFKLYIFSLNVKGLIFVLDSLLKRKDTRFIIECYNDEICVGSNLFIFASSGKIESINPFAMSFAREALIKKQKSVTHSVTVSNFIPEDFLLISRDENNSDLKELFNKLATSYAAQFIFDIFEVDSVIGYKLNGYKSISASLDYNMINSLCSNAKTYIKIYQWIYNDGNLIDKIGLSRNIISLNINKYDLSIEDRTFEAVKSCYKIYQTQNIKQYIEVRNKISDQLFDIYNKADKITDNFIGHFKKSIFTFISFLISVVAIRVISKGDFIGGFNMEVTLFTIGLLIISLIVMLYNRWEINEQISRYENFYENLKLRYLDLLDQSDINRILNDDRDFNDSIKFIKSKRKYYTFVWLISIIVLFIIVGLIFSFNAIDFIYIRKILKNIIRCFIENI